MIKIDLDGINSYKTIVASAKDFLKSTKDTLISTAQNLKGISIDSESLSQNNPSYTAQALETKKASIVSDIYSKVNEIDNIISSLDKINTLCDSYISDVESDEEELLKILGIYGDETYNFLHVEDYTVTDDILTFDPANCDYYINKRTKIFFQIPNDKQTEEKYKIRDIDSGSCVKCLFSGYNADEENNENNYSVVLCKIGKDYRIGYVNKGDLSPITIDAQGNTTSKNNLDDDIVPSSGYGVIKNKENVTIKPFPNSNQGEHTEAIHSSAASYVTDIPYGTSVKIIGEWRNEEQDVRSSYLVSFTTDNGNFMGFVDGKDLEISTVFEHTKTNTSPNESEDTEKKEIVIPKGSSDKKTD